MRARTLWTKSMAAKCGGIILVLSGACALPYSLITRMMTVHVDTDHTTATPTAAPSDDYLCYPTEPKAFIMGYTLFRFMAIYILPVASMMVLYGSIARKLLNVKAQSIQSQKTIQSRKKVVHMLVAMVTVFAICWMPAIIYMVVVSIQGDDISFSSMMPGVFPVMGFMIYFNCISNPFLYSFMSTQYREGFKALLMGCMCCCGKKKAGDKLETYVPSVSGSDVIGKQTKEITLQTSTTGE